jgi:hypothetical protein
MALPAQFKRLGIPDDPELKHGDILTLRWDAYQQCFRALIGSTMPPQAGVDLVDAASVVADASRGNYFMLKFTGAIGATRAMGRPVNLFDQETYTFRFLQDSVVGGRSINAWDAIFDWNGQSIPAFQTALQRVDLFVFKYDAHVDKLTFVSHEVDW